MTDSITQDNYVLHFGKYKNFRANDVADITTVGKDGTDKYVGLEYLKWLVKQEWFKHASVVQSIIDETEKSLCIQGKVIEPEVKKKEIKERVKKEKKPKKETNKISIEMKKSNSNENILNFGN